MAHANWNLTVTIQELIVREPTNSLNAFQLLSIPNADSAPNEAVDGTKRSKTWLSSRSTNVHSSNKKRISQTFHMTKPGDIF